jgi:hypothetical protein
MVGLTAYCNCDKRDVYLRSNTFKGPYNLIPQAPLYIGMLDLHIALGERESAVVAAIAYVTGGSSELTQ